METLTKSQENMNYGRDMKEANVAIKSNSGNFEYISSMKDKEEMKKLIETFKNSTFPCLDKINVASQRKEDAVGQLSRSMLKEAPGVRKRSAGIYYLNDEDTFVIETLSGEGNTVRSTSNAQDTFRKCNNENRYMLNQPAIKDLRESCAI